MKNSSRFFVGISLLVLAVCCCRCGVENSKAEMEEAQKAMDKAKSVFAEDLASSNWQEAMQSWDQGQAAVKAGKPSKTFFLRAKSRFEKTAAIAKASGDRLSKDIQTMQLAIGEHFAKVKTGMERNKYPSKVQNRIKPIIAEIEEGNATIDNLVSQGNYPKANSLAKEILTKLYNTDLIIAGKKVTP
jgi:hypothetical protein